MIEPNHPVFELVNYSLDKSGLTQFQAAELSKRGLLSFDHEKVGLASYEIEELAFLKRLYFDSGLDSRAVSAMLSKLKRPYRYSFDKIYWDFGTGDWRETKLT